MEQVLRLIDGYGDGRRVKDDFCVAWVVTATRNFQIESVDRTSQPVDAVNHLAAALGLLAPYAAAIEVVVDIVTGPKTPP